MSGTPDAPARLPYNADIDAAAQARAEMLAGHVGSGRLVMLGTHPFLAAELALRLSGLAIRYPPPAQAGPPGHPAPGQHPVPLAGQRVPD